jgi:hypothetical protein
MRTCLREYYLSIYLIQDWNRRTNIKCAFLESIHRCHHYCIEWYRHTAGHIRVYSSTSVYIGCPSIASLNIGGPNIEYCRLLEPVKSGNCKLSSTSLVHTGALEWYISVVYAVGGIFVVTAPFTCLSLAIILVTPITCNLFSQIGYDLVWWLFYVSRYTG